MPDLICKLVLRSDCCKQVNYFYQKRPVFALKNYPRPQRPKRPMKAKKGQQSLKFYGSQQDINPWPAVLLSFLNSTYIRNYFTSLWYGCQDLNCS